MDSKNQNICRNIVETQRTCLEVHVLSLLIVRDCIENVIDPGVISLALTDCPTIEKVTTVMMEELGHDIKTISSRVLLQLHSTSPNSTSNNNNKSNQSTSEQQQQQQQQHPPVQPPSQIHGPTGDVCFDVGTASWDFMDHKEVRCTQERLGKNVR